MGKVKWLHVWPDICSSNDVSIEFQIKNKIVIAVRLKKDMLDHDIILHIPWQHSGLEMHKIQLWSDEKCKKQITCFPN